MHTELPAVLKLFVGQVVHSLAMLLLNVLAEQSANVTGDKAEARRGAHLVRTPLPLSRVRACVRETD